MRRIGWHQSASSQSRFVDKISKMVSRSARYRVKNCFRRNNSLGFRRYYRRGVLYRLFHRLVLVWMHWSWRMVMMGNRKAFVIGCTSLKVLEGYSTA